MLFNLTHLPSTHWALEAHKRDFVNERMKLGLHVT